MLDETTPTDDTAAPPLPLAVHPCNRPGVGLPAITASPRAEMPMKRCNSEPEQLAFPWPRPKPARPVMDVARFFVARDGDRDPELEWGDRPEF